MKLHYFILAILVLMAGACGSHPAGPSALEAWEKMGPSSEPSEEPSEDPSEDIIVDPSTEDPSAEDPSEEPELTPESRWFQTRGVIVGWNDIAYKYPNSVDYLRLAREHHLNAISTGGMDKSLSVWKEFVKEATQAGVKFETQQHAMGVLLPRNLFDEHPEYFRMDKQGNRVKDVNGCPSSEGALEEIARNAKVLGAENNPTNHRYYFWMDDGGDVCYCDKCKGLSPADQALMFENRIIVALKEIDPDATLAHLAYNNTTNAPTKVKPAEDLFLEFAPIHRNYSHPLSETWAEGNGGWTHAKYLKALQDNLKVFPAETALVLEYWIDDSLFSSWNPNKLVAVPWNKDLFLDDLKTYAKYGIRHITSFCVYVGPDYVKKFGYPTFMEEYADGLWEFEKQ